MYALNPDGTYRPADCEATAFADPMRIAKVTKLKCSEEGTEVRVSTVFLCIDHGFGGGDPMLWETMIFGDWPEEYQERYTSGQDAIEGHDRAVAMVSATGSWSAIDNTENVRTLNGLVTGER